MANKQAFHNNLPDMRNVFSWGLKLSDYKERFIRKSGGSVDDIVRTDWTFVNEVTDQKFVYIANMWEEFLADVEVKPATGTIRTSFGFHSIFSVN